MKLSSVVLAGSLGLNAVLIAILVVGTANDSAPAPAAARPPSALVAQKTETTPAPETWDALKSGELSAQRDRLRAEGFPPATVRAILTAQIRETFAARRKALEDAQANTPFLKNPAALDPKLQAEFRALSKLEQQALKDLLGPDLENGYAATLRRQLPEASAATIEQLAAIRERYDDQRQEIYAQARNAPTPDEREKMLALDKAMHAEFAAVLSPQELEDYDLRASSTANQLRYNLTAFDPTEAEFRGLYKLQSVFDEQYRMVGGPLAQDFMRARNEAQTKLNADIAALLGPDRFLEYQRATDYNFRQTNLLVGRFELPPQIAIDLWTVQKDFEKRRGEIYSPATPAADRAAQLTALQQEAVAKVTPLLGGDPSRVEVYKQNGGQWLQSLVPRPPVPPPKQ